MSALLLRRLLAALLCRPNETVPIGELTGALWGEDPPPTAHKTLLVYLRRLRIALGANDRIIREPAGYRLVAKRGEFDVTDFLDLVAEATAAEGAQALGLLTEALQLWQGNAFGDVRDYAPIADHARVLDDERVRVEEWRARLCLEAGLHAELVPRLTELVESYPYREDFPAHLMLALYRLGRQTEAVAVYHRTRQLLADELGIEPGSRLRDLVAQILQGDPALAYKQGRNFLPRDIPYFAGRSKEIDYLSDLAGEGGATLIQAIDGMAGVGKTALAVHVSHRLAGAFPHGLLFIDLHGHTENRDPLTVDEALDQLLREAGVPDSRIPGDADGKSALWRSELAGRKVLVLLDNASSPAQVRPLLPGTRECTVLITSRRRLIGLDGVRVVSLDTLPEAEAVALLTRIAGLEAGDLDTVGEVVRLCGLLPLAISIVAARLRSRPSWTLDDLVDRLTDEHTRFALLEAQDSGVAAAFGLSYQYLSPGLQRFYRMLGLHPGRDIDRYSAAALVAVPVAKAERMLEELCDVHLLNAQAAGCYQLHDLVREHAAARAAEEEPQDSRDRARERLLDFYLHVTELAADQISPVRRKLGPPPQRPPSDAPEIGDLAAAVAWFEAEHANLVPLVRLAGKHSALSDGTAQHGWQIPRNCAVYLLRGGHLEVTRQLLESATTAAARPGSDPGAYPTCLVNLGMVVNDLGEYRTGLGYVNQAIAHARSVGDRDGEQALLGYLAEGLMHNGRYQEAAEVASDCAEIYRQQGAWGREAIALSLHLLAMAHLGRPQEGLRILQRCSREVTTLELDRIGCILYEAAGVAYSRAGTHDLALHHLRGALEGTRNMNDKIYEGRRLHRLAEAERRAGFTAEALRHALEAHQLLDDNLSVNDIVECHNTLGAIHLDLGRHDEALAHFSTALALAESKEVHIDHARAIDGIGDALSAQGDLESARQRWRQAFEIYEGLGVLAAESTRVKLDHLPNY